MPFEDEVIDEAIRTILREREKGNKMIVVTNPRFHQEIGLGYVEYTLATTLTGNEIVIEDIYLHMGSHKGTQVYLAKRA